MIPSSPASESPLDAALRGASVVTAALSGIGAFWTPASLLLLTVLCLTVYDNSYDCAFQFDDFTGITQKQELRADFLDWDSFHPWRFSVRWDWDRFREACGGGEVYRERPLSNLSFAINMAQAGRPGVQELGPQIFRADLVRKQKETLWYFHVFNVAVHVGAAWFCYLLAFELLLLAGRDAALARRLALVVALVWAVHPLQTQAVTYLLQRMTSMAALFSLVSLHAFLRGWRCRRAFGARTLWWLWSLLCLVAGLLTKEIAAAVPIAMLALAFWRLVLLRAPRPFSWAVWRPVIGVLAASFLLTAGAVVFYSTTTLSFDRWAKEIVDRRPVERDFTTVERLLTQARVVGLYYPVLLALPHPKWQNVDHDVAPTRLSVTPWSVEPPDPDRPSHALRWAETLLGATLFGLLVAAAWRRRHGSPMLLFGVGWYLVFLAIESTVIPLEMMFEHRLYLPSLGVFLAGAALALDAWRTWSERTRLAALAAGFLILGAAIAGVESARNWGVLAALLPLTLLVGLRSRAALCCGAVGLIAALIVTLSIAASHRNQVWKTHKALWADAAEKSPYKARVFNNLAVGWGVEAIAAYQAGRREDQHFAAKRQIEAARHAVTRCDRTFWEAWHNLGAGLTNFPDRALEALDAFESTLYYHEDSSATYASLVQLTQRLHADTGDPMYEAKYNLYSGCVHEFQHKNFPTARVIYQSIVTRMPEWVAARYRLGLVLCKLAEDAESDAQRKTLRREAHEHLEYALQHDRTPPDLAFTTIADRAREKIALLKNKPADNGNKK